MIIFLSFEVLVGVIIHVKKVRKVKIDKHITWELEVYSSVICMIYIAVCLSLDVMEYTCPELSDSVKFLIRFVAPVVKTLGVNMILFHTLSVAIYKYYVILVKQPMTFDNKNMDFKWVLFFIIYPILWTILNFLRSTTEIETLLPPTLTCQSNGFSDQMTLFCNFDDETYYNNKRTFIYIASQIYCIVHGIINIVLKFNILEGFLYFKIFRFMNR